MTRAEFISMTVAVAIAIGCGGGTSQDADAKTEQEQATPSTQVAQATAQQASAAAPAKSAPGGGSATIQGVARFTGSAPAREQVTMSADPVCESQRSEPVYSEAAVVNDNGTLRHVFVYVKEGLSGAFPAPTSPVTLDQVGCWYAPHVFGIQANQPLEIVNSDATLHNVNAKPTANRPFNVAQPVKGMKTSKSFTTPEVMVKFKCNVHPWMTAYAGVVAHPFFSVSGADGRFAITGLPAGTYVLEAWHETYGTQTTTVSVGDGETASADLTFSGP